MMNKSEVVSIVFAVLLLHFIHHLHVILATNESVFFFSGDELGPDGPKQGQIYSRNSSKVSMGVSSVACAASCLAEPECVSFNFEKPTNGSTAGAGGAGDSNTAGSKCTSISGSDWKKDGFKEPTTPGQEGQFHMMKLPYSVKAAIASNSSEPPPANVIWPTDCVWWGTRHAYLVGMRNFNDESSALVDEIKCRQFYGDDGFWPVARVELDWTVTPVVVGLVIIGSCSNGGTADCRTALICPDGWAITAIHSALPGLASPTHIKCMKLKYPWTTDIWIGLPNLYRANRTAPRSDLNDPSKSGTVSGRWNFQCRDVDIMDEIYLRSSDNGKYDYARCRRFKRL